MGQKRVSLIVDVERLRTEIKYQLPFCFKELLLLTEAYWQGVALLSYCICSAIGKDRSLRLSNIFHEFFEYNPQIKEVFTLASKEAELCSSMGRHGDKIFC